MGPKTLELSFLEEFTDAAAAAGVRLNSIEPHVSRDSDGVWLIGLQLEKDRYRWGLSLREDVALDDLAGHMRASALENWPS